MTERERLDTLIGHLAHKHQCPPYLIAGNKEKELLLEQRPTACEELAQIKGFPADGKRVKGWGEELCAFFRNEPTDTNNEIGSFINTDPLGR